ncbi:MAG: anti-sigma factor [Pyrinomonadaceae bacterium]
MEAREGTTESAPRERITMTVEHLSFEKLADFAENRLPVAQREAAQAHVDTCAQCEAQFKQLNGLLNLMRADAAEDAPRDVLARALNIFTPRAPVATASAKPSAVKRLLAALSFDSLQAVPAFGVRSGQTSTRQLLYSAGETDLDIRLHRQNETWIVSGQVLGAGACEGFIELRGVEKSERAVLNDSCEFTLPAVPSGKYTLNLRLAETEIEVPQLELET